MIYGNAIITRKEPQTYIFEDESGNQITGVYVDKETIFTATDNDVREGLVYASDKGQSVGTKDIPIYYASCGCKFVLANKQATISIPEYNYNNLMVIITTYDTSIEQSLVSTYVVIDNGVYEIGNSTKLSDVVIDTYNEQIDLGIAVSEKSVLRYFVLKEEY